jgi:GT2 family glycosyltransferase
VVADLLLVVVGYHPSELEVDTLASCLVCRSSTVAVAVIANDHQPGEPIDRLAKQVDLFLPSSRNLGYGRAFHAALEAYRARQAVPPWVAVLNTDLSWRSGSFERMLAWLQHQPDVVLAVPKILDPAGRPQQLCKRDPTLLSLASRRFVPRRIKPHWLRRYDAYQQMAAHSLDQVFDVPYLSGCCMLIRHSALEQAGGFNQRFFLYLEDADITRRLRRLGRCVHLPVAEVVHAWGRGNHRSLWLTLVNLQSAWIYFTTWGWRWW